MTSALAVGGGQMLVDMDEMRRLILEGLERLGKTQTEAAQAAGLPLPKVNRFLNAVRGKRGEDVLEMINKLAEAAGVDSAAFLSQPLQPVDTWPQLPVIGIRSIPALQGGALRAAEAIRGAATERIRLPVDDQSAYAIRIAAATLTYAPGDLLVISPTASFEPGDAVAVQIGPRTEIGQLQISRDGSHLVAIEGFTFGPEECILLGRVIGVWRTK